MGRVVRPARRTAFFRVDPAVAGQSPRHRPPAIPALAVATGALQRLLAWR